MRLSFTTYNSLSHTFLKPMQTFHRKNMESRERHDIYCLDNLKWRASIKPTFIKNTFKTA